LLLSAGLSASVPLAWADGGIDTFDVSGKVSPTGMLSITSTINFAGTAPAQFVQQFDTTLPGEDYTFYRFDITNMTATAGGVDLKPSVTQDGDYLVLSVDTSAIGSAPLVIAYDVTGAAMDGGLAVGNVAMTNVRWAVLQGLNLPVATATGTISVPGMIRGVDCKAGTTSGPQPCQMFGGGTYDAPSPNFQQTNLGAGQVVIFSFLLPSDTVATDQQVEARWTLDRAFSVDTTPLLVALAVLILGVVALFMLWRLRGRDVVTPREPTIVASFEPTGKGTVKFEVHDKIRPGHVGTVVDERVDPIDITATVLDLAVRGHLGIIQMPSDGLHRPIDWTFLRLDCKDKLRPFEQTLLDAIAPADGPAAVVSQIGGPIEDVIVTVQNQLYQDAVERGWFARRPDQTRHLFSVIGWITLAAAIVAMVLLVATTRLGLLGLVLVALAAGLLTIGRDMPRRTAAGVSLLHGLNALSMSLQTQPTNQIPKLTAYDDISAILPYAVVLGGRARWVQALADADDDPGVPDPDDLAWYHAPADWNLEDLPVCLDSFIAHLSGRLVGRD